MTAKYYKKKEIHLSISSLHDHQIDSFNIHGNEFT